VLVGQQKCTFIFGGKNGFLEKLCAFREERCVKEGVLGLYRGHKFIYSEIFSKGFLCYLVLFMVHAKGKVVPMPDTKK